jgi:HlyD family secretion protein
MLRLAGSAAVAAALVAAVAGMIAKNGAPKTPVATEVVKRGALQVTVTEHGNLESANNLTLRCLVESPTGTSVLKIVEEGTTVKKDQVVVELDSSRLRDELVAQQIRLDTAIAALKVAEANTTIQVKQNESDVAATELKLLLARLDLLQYREGEYPQSSTLVRAEIDLAGEYLARAVGRLAFTERLLRRGFTTTKVRSADGAAVRRAEIDLAVAHEKQRVLDGFTRRRELAEREASEKILEQEVERVKLRAEAALAQRERNLLAAKRTHFLERERYEKIVRQIAACTIRTPRDGMVVYANPADGRRSAGGPQIFEGAVVRERQALIELPDARDMQVSARIHESRIAQIEEGQPATIHLDARPGETYHGRVSQVALVPNSGTWPNPDRKEYTALIKIDGAEAQGDTLRPGMTAEVEILADRRDDVLQAPVQSCVERGGRYFAWVLEDDEELQRHEIAVGISNQAAIEIVDGLDEGDEVVLNPRSVLPDEVARLEQEIAPERETPPILRRPRPAAPTPRPPAKSPGESNDGSNPGPTPLAAPAPSASPAPVAPVAAAADRKDETESRRVAATDANAVFNRLDKNCDSRVTESELPDPMKPVLTRMDTNGDKAIDRDEWTRGARAWAQQAESRQ